MGRAIDYCKVCGDRVAPADLERGIAVHAGDSVYCKKCKAQAPAPTPGAKPKSGSTGTFHAVKPGGPATQRLQHSGQGASRAPQVAHGNSRPPMVGHGTQRIPAGGPATQRLNPVGPATQRLQHMDDTPEPSSASSKIPLIAGGVALLVLIGAGTLFLVQSSKDKATAALVAKHQADAKAAFEEVVKYRQENPDDPVGLLKLIDDSAKKVQKSEWASKLRAERDDAETRKKTQDIIKARKVRLDEFRGRIPTSTDLGALAEEIDRVAKEWAGGEGDEGTSKDATLLAKFVRESRVKGALEAAKQYEVKNPEAYEEIIRLFSDALGFATEPGYEAFLKDAKDGMDAAKRRRETAAEDDFKVIKAKVETLRGEKKYDDAIRELRDFVARRKGTIVQDEAQKLAWAVEEDRKKAATPDRTNAPPADPAKLPPKDWTTLWDPKAQSGWKIGGSKASKWEGKDGAMIGTNPLTAEEAAKDGQGGVGFWYYDRAFARYEMECEVTLVKGEGLFVVGVNGVDAQPPVIPIRSAAANQGAQTILELGKLTKAKVTVTADKISIAIGDAAAVTWNFQGSGDGKDHGAGVLGFAVQPASEIQIRNVRIRAIP